MVPAVDASWDLRPHIQKESRTRGRNTLLNSPFRTLYDRNS